jgi:hypothetical protein
MEADINSILIISIHKVVILDRLVFEIRYPVRRLQ